MYSAFIESAASFFSKWNINSIKFYESLGAKKMDEWVGMRLEGDAIHALANLTKPPA